MNTLHGILFLLLQGFVPSFGQSWSAGNPHWTNRYRTGMVAPGIESVHISGDTGLGGKRVKIFSKHLVMESNLLANDFPIWYFCNYGNGNLTFEDRAGGCPPLPPACDILVQIIQAVECPLPMVVSTGEILMPCTAPDSFFNLPVGSFAKISYMPASCASICQQGTYVAITCLDGVTNSLPGLDNVSPEVRLHPNPASGDVFVENFAPEEILIFDARGAVVKTIFPGAEAHFSVEGLPPGGYVVKMSNRKRVAVKKLRVD